MESRNIPQADVLVCLPRLPISGRRPRLPAQFKVNPAEVTLRFPPDQTISKVSPYDI